MPLAESLIRLVCAAVVCSTFLANLARGDDSQFILDDNSTDGDAVAQSEGRIDVKAVRTNNDRISDAAFATFSRWPNLYGVYLWNSTATGTGFVKLEKHEHLIQVRLLGPNVNDEGVRAVSRLPHVTHLHFGNAYSVSKDCKYHVHHPLVTDQALEAVAQMKHVAYLSIDNAAVTDEGIQKLASLKGVESIRFWRCAELTVKGIERLRAALPRAMITAYVPDIAVHE